jgi:LysM repeat protein
MRRSYCLLALTFLLLTAYSPTYAQFDEVGWLLTQINCLRQSRGVGPLSINASLTTSANQHSAYLSANRGGDVHVEADGSTPLSRATNAGYKGYVGENVVGGGSVQRAFAWWLNDDIHYRNIVNVYWTHVGIGISSGPHGKWYTLDFGAPSWKANRIPAAPCGGFSPPTSSPPNIASGNPPAPKITATPQQPSYVLGVDEKGNIKHQVQQGDTLGHIALIYGYTWDDLPDLLALNNMTEADFRKLKVGAIFLVPPKSGTFTPTPDTGSPTPTSAPPTATDIPAIATVTSVQPIAMASATSEALPTLTSTPARTSISMVATVTVEPGDAPRADAPNPIRSLIPWAILLQGVVLGGLFIGSIIRRHR